MIWKRTSLVEINKERKQIERERRDCMGAKRFSAGMLFLRSLLVVLVMMAGVSTVGATDSGTGITAGAWITVLEPGAIVTYQYVLDDDGIEADNRYLIAAGLNKYAMTGSGAIGATNRGEVEFDGNRTTAIAQTRSLEWIITNDGRIKTGNGDYWVTATPTSTSCEIKLATDESLAYAWQIDRSSGGNYRITAPRQTNKSWYLCYNNNTFEMSRNPQEVRLFRYDSEIKTVTDPAVSGIPGLYAKLSGPSTCGVAVGSSKEVALAAIKAAVDGYICESMELPTIDAAGTILMDDDLVWSLDGDYNGSEPGEYTVTVSYEGKVLGDIQLVVYAVRAENRYYTTLLEALAQENSAQIDLAVPHTVESGECLDLRGCHIEGTVTVEEGGCIIDTATDAFDADVAGSISDYTGPSVFSPAETSSAHGKHYVTIPVNDADGNRIKTEFHRVAVSATAFRFALSKGQIYLSVEAKFRGSVTDKGVCAGLDMLENIGFEINETINETKTAVPGSMYQDSGQAITSLIPDSENTLAVHFSFLADLDAVYTIRAKLCFSGVSALSTERTIDLREVLTSAQKEFQLQADDETLEPDVRSSARNSAAVIGRYLGT